MRGQPGRPASSRVSVCTEDEPASEEASSHTPPEGVIVERKWDGDRVQVHLMPAGAGKLPEVRMFTRHGTPVHGMYSSVAKAFQNCFKDEGCLGFVLDGELIVVDEVSTSYSKNYITRHALVAFLPTLSALFFGAPH